MRFPPSVAPLLLALVLTMPASASVVDVWAERDPAGAAAWVAALASDRADRMSWVGDPTSFVSTTYSTPESGPLVGLVVFGPSTATWYFLGSGLLPARLTAGYSLRRDDPPQQLVSLGPDEIHALAAFDTAGELFTVSIERPLPEDFDRLGRLLNRPDGFVLEIGTAGGESIQTFYSAVPEPTSASLLLPALATLWKRRRGACP